ncbi:MAG TPA: MBL fold metallo-hydrolase [Flavipsychrobacter sp.]|nr:MBL fold metallo-hydrolase [Flavipsychrobacter sp.]
MLQLQSFTFNPFQENTYIISNEKNQCWIIDPGMYDTTETNHLITHIDHNHLTPQAIINTHTHIDHIFGVQPLKDRYNIPFHIHHADLPVLQNAPAAAAMFGLQLSAPPQPYSFIDHHQPLHLGTHTLHITHTPGHSPGSISLYYPEGNWVISGDVRFRNSIGRTDLPGGNHHTLLSSIRTPLLPLPPHTTVYSGHGPTTTIAEEIKHNPFLQTP